MAELLEKWQIGQLCNANDDGIKIPVYFDVREAGKL